MLTKEEAIKLVNSKPKNNWLHYYVCKWNDGYCINDSTYMKRNPNVKYVYVSEHSQTAQN